MYPHLDRRGFLKASSLALMGVGLAGSLGACARSGGEGAANGGAQNVLKINSFGGTFQEAVQSVVVDPFQEKFDAQVSVTTAISSEALTQLRSSPEGKPALDVAYMDLVPIYQARAAGLLQPMDRAKIPSLGEMYPLAVDEEGYWVAELVSMTGIAYNTEHVKTPPTSWKQLWDKEYEGRVAISNVSGTAGYQFLAQMARIHGGSETEIDPGFEAVAKLKPNLAAIYNTPDEMSRLLSSGEAWLGPWYADRLSSLKRQGAPVAFVTPEEGAMAILSSMCIPKGTSQLDLAHNYIDFQISAEVNKKFITTIAEGPTNSTVELDQAFLDENYIPYGTEAIEQLVALDNQAIAENLADWVTRWQSEIAN
ncbi:ABC transporter substrate-binding protein [Ornithinimicrobium cavernae]|uniref:ABC transporter substrate-binding protein n=1 Tax=Ornithinimicrobium cavernae TaxID=2666047 RepID=UPI000D695779|nr:ABC transporter substrate-binding protein [Ornithinimicrobium cavernae]